MNTSIPRFARKNGAVHFTSREPIALSDLEKVAPSVFADRAHESRSARYTHIPTRDVLSAIVAEGFKPYSVFQGGSRDEGKRGFTKHLIRFRHDSAARVVGSHHTEICLLNSHDGTSSYKLFAGVFRLVCSNGLVVGDGEIAEVRVPHSGDVVSRVVDGCIEVLSALPEVNDRVAQFSSLQLTEGERRAFGAAALAAKYEGPAPVTIDQVLAPQRGADVNRDAWSTLNVVQENLIRGGLAYAQRDEQGRLVANRRTRPVNGVDGNVALNRALWTLTSELARYKAA
jgi:hypothetical protein